MSEYVEVHDVKVIGTSSITNNNGVAHHFLPYKRFAYVLGINNYVKQLAPDVVIVAGLMYPMQLMLLRKMLLKKVKIIVQHHAEKSIGSLRSVIQKFAKGSIDAYFFSAKGLAYPWIKKNLVEQRMVYEIMEASSIFNQLPKQTAKEVTGAIDSLVYLWVGRFNQNKDPLTAVQAFSKFAKMNDEVKLYMIYSDNDLEDDVKKAISSLGMEDKIKLNGKVSHSEMSQWYSSADFIISTSHYEGSGIAVCEAMSCGCIPILSNIPSFIMMTDNGSCGILFQPGDVQCLVEALNKSLVIDKEEMQRSVLAHFKAKLSFSAIARGMVEVFQKL